LTTSSPWPGGCQRIPEEEWVSRPLNELAVGYDTVEHHGWYRNLEPTLDKLEGTLQDGDILMDYSGGTGILADRLLQRMPERRFGVLIVDSSPKFLRMAVEKLGEQDRVAFRLIPYLKEEKRLRTVDEVLGPELLQRGIDQVVSTNAIHLYYDLGDTLASWLRVLRRGGLLHVQSGNIRNPEAGPDEWIIDGTVEAIHKAAMEIVQEESRFAAYRSGSEDPERMARYDRLRSKYFIPIQALGHYVAAIRGAGFKNVEVSTATIQARVDEWYDFLAVYHEGVLGWIGGAKTIEGHAPSPEAVEDRLALIQLAMHRVFAGKEAFAACWTYINAAF
jgi:ubiquinone/menaquinone biosynthesis C-methylase UbiE